jgi:hypothetical protein
VTVRFTLKLNEPLVSLPVIFGWYVPGSAPGAMVIVNVEKDVPVTDGGLKTTEKFTGKPPVT